MRLRWAHPMATILAKGFAKRESEFENYFSQPLTRTEKNGRERKKIKENKRKQKKIKEDRKEEKREKRRDHKR